MGLGREESSGSRPLTTPVPKETGAARPALKHAWVSQSEGVLRPLLEAALARRVEARFEADGSSMLRLVRPGDMIRTSASEEDVPRLGDLVVVPGPGEQRLLVHRVVAKTGEAMVVRGDNCRAADGLFAPQDIIGIVTRVERDGRSVWYGAGRLGRPVAFAVRHGLIWRANRWYYGARRHAARALKFLGADSRLRPQKGDDGNE